MRILLTGHFAEGKSSVYFPYVQMEELRFSGAVKQRIENTRLHNDLL